MLLSALKQCDEMFVIKNVNDTIVSVYAIGTLQRNVFRIARSSIFSLNLYFFFFVNFLHISGYLNYTTTLT